MDDQLLSVNCAESDTVLVWQKPSMYCLDSFGAAGGTTGSAENDGSKFFS